MQLRDHLVLWLMAVGAASFEVCVKAKQGKDCVEDDCYKAVCGTSENPNRPMSALVDCMDYILGSATHTGKGTLAIKTATAVPVTSSVMAAHLVPLPEYATVCGGLPQYSSACSCLGVTETDLLATSSGSSSAAEPTFIPHIQTDLLNCGRPGNICRPTESCLGGVCSEASCTAQTCETGFTAHCNGNNSCLCFQRIDGGPVCAADDVCRSLALCQKVSDCGPGKACVISSCCNSKYDNTTGVCLSTDCPSGQHTDDVELPRKRGTAAFS